METVMESGSVSFSRPLLVISELILYHMFKLQGVLWLTLITLAELPTLIPLIFNIDGMFPLVY